jgi:hypothetical protein
MRCGINMERPVRAVTAKDPEKFTGSERGLVFLNPVQQSPWFS